MKKILVAGHTGFLGKHIFSFLSETTELELVGASRTNGFDFSRSASLQKLPKVDLVVNLAGKAGVTESYKNPREIFESNFNTTLNLLDYCRITNSKLIHLSSYMYGNPESLPITENHPIEILSPYAQSKYFGEMLCQNYSENFDLDISIIRPFNLYGPNEPASSLIGSIVSQLKAGPDVKLQGVAAKRDFVHVSDLGFLIKALMTNFPKGLEVFNLGLGKSRSAVEVIEIIESLLHRKIKIHDLGSHRPHEIMDCYGASEKAERLLGFKPKVSLPEGLTTVLKTAGLL